MTGVASIASRFDWIAAVHSDAVALRAPGRALTYRELDLRSAELAHHMVSAGVGRGSVVAIHLERSIEMIVAILATVRAGGAYLPIDPALPAMRLGQILSDVPPAVLVSGDPDALADAPRGGTILDPQERPPLGPSSALPLMPAMVGADDLAYILFTSGSTGRPNGVQVTHGNVLRLVVDVDYVQLSPHEVFLQLAPASFDASTFEIWAALLNGATLVVAPAGPMSAGELGSLIDREGITTLWLTAGLFNQMIDHEAPSLRGVRQLLAGGDVLSVEHCRRALSLLPSTRLINGYGPTEATTFTCCHTVTEADLAGPIPIGRPIAGATAHVLDEAMRPVAPGQEGELFIGGPGVARGYAGRPELNAARFVPDPFSTAPGARLYRSGDRVKVRPDGLLQFVCRNDRQVKINGFRIELGEVESAMRCEPSVRDAVATVVAGAQGQHHLAGYVVQRNADDPRALQRLRAHLDATLPAHAIPSWLVPIEDIPLTANGKVDVAALPRAVPLQAAHGSMPATALEHSVASIWCEVLGLERIDVQASLLNLGGHSLDAMRIIARLRTELGIELPMRAFFEDPTVEGCVRHAERIDDSSRSPAPSQAIDRVRTSRAEQRIAYLHGLAPGLPLYTVAAVLRLEGGVEPNAVQRSLIELARRHDALRSTFTMVDGELQRTIANTPRFPLTTIDLASTAPEVDLRQAADARANRGEPSGPGAVREERIFRECSSRTFDLAVGPLAAATLIVDSRTRLLLHLAFHHIVVDGWSLSLLVNELRALLAGAVAGSAALLPPPVSGVQALAEEAAAEADAEQALPFWRRYLQDAPAHQPLPYDRPRPTVPSFRGGTVRFSIPAGIWQPLAEFARRRGATPFMALHAAVSLLLSRYSGLNDVVVGTAVANRRSPMAERSVGMFVNTLPVRTAVRAGGTFADLLASTRESTLEALAHQATPFDRIVDAVRPERRPGLPALFQVMLALHNLAWDDGAGGSRTLSVEAVDLETGTAKFDLSISCIERDGGLRGSVEYAADLFDRSTALRIAGHLERVIDQIARDPSIDISAVEPAGEDELDWLRHVSAGPSAPVTARTIVDFVDQQVRSSPQATAIVADDERLTYAELDRRIRGLATRLRRLGAGPGTVIGVCVERSPWYPVALLAVLSAGAICLPLDPAHPPDRIAFMLADSGAAMVVATRTGRTALRAQVRVVQVGGDTVDDQGPGDPDLAKARAADDVALVSETKASSTPEQTAFLLYTSGSTGTPKGVRVGHAGLVNLGEAQRRLYDLGPGDRVLQMSGPTFDASINDLMFAFASGAELHVARRESLLPGPELARLLRERRITFVVMVPSALSALPPTPLPDLRLLVVGGEVLTAALVERWGANRRMVNVYGPTEGTIYATTFECTRGGAEPPIGRPIPNVRVHVLDDRGRPAPIGVAGEIAIGGLATTLGYHDRPALTAERFTTDPTEPGHRIYRTGDRGCWRSDGLLEFLGRRDRQIKLRGVRIELGEIERRIVEISGVTAAVLATADDPLTGMTLRAWVSAAAGIDAPRIRAELQRVLPAAMVPSTITLLERLPVTSHGKVDMAALAALPSLAAPSAAGDEPALVGDEAAIAAVWRELLGVSPGPQDNFFELGGHSLAVTRMLFAVEQRLGCAPPMADFLAAPTVRATAAAISGRTPGSPARPIIARAKRQPFRTSQNEPGCADA